MSDIVTLNGYKIKDEKAVRSYENVAQMKADTKLKEGYHVKTKGYYEANDGGHGEYIIVNDDTLVDDGGSIHVLSNGLRAELIIENKININTFGADSTGETDSSLIIQKALDFINNRWINEKYDINTIVFNGTYLINNTLEMSPFARLTGDGYTIFKTDISPVIWIHYPNGTIPSSFIGTKQQYQYANLIDFPKGCLFKNIDGDLQNTCIEIGEHSDLTYTHNVSRFKLSNFAIQNYDIGILHNPFNVYMCNYERLHIELNNIGVKFGNHSTIGVNSGEHMLFDNCLIAGCNYAFMYETSGFDLEVVNSSFDFNKYIVSDPYAKGYHRISFSTSHIEGNEYFLGTIGYPSIINIINNTIYTRVEENKNYQFMTLDDIDSSVTSGAISDMALNNCYLKNNKIGYPVVSTTSNPVDMVNLSYMNVFDIDNYCQSNIEKLQITKGNILEGLFDSLTDGDVDISTNATLSNGKLKVGYNAWLKTTGKIVTDNYLYSGHKSLEFYKFNDGTSQSALNVETNLIPVKKTYYTASYITYNKKTGGSITFYFYDKDGNELSHTNGYVYHPYLPTTNNTWYITTHTQKVVVPLNATYFKVAFNLGNWNNSEAQAEDTVYKIGGLIIN